MRFEASSTHHARLRDALRSASLGPLDGFTFDGSFSRHRGWIGPDGRLWVHDDTYDSFYGVDDGANAIDLVASRDGTDARLALMRVVRELATIASLRIGRLPVHGAAFALDDLAVLVCGPKRAGKTSLLVHALRCGCPFVSNDRLFVDVAGPANVEGMPTIVMLRNRTLDFFEDLKRTYEKARFDRARTIDECAPGVERPDPRAGVGFDRPGISPAQFCGLLNVPMRGDARVGMILFPVIEPDVSGMRVEPLPTDLARRTLERSLLKPSHPTRYSQVFSRRGDGEQIPAEVEAERCRRLVEQVPVYSCRLGPDAYRADIRRVLQRALRSGSFARSTAPTSPRPGPGPRPENAAR